MAQKVLRPHGVLSLQVLQGMAHREQQAQAQEQETTVTEMTISPEAIEHLMRVLRETWPPFPYWGVIHEYTTKEREV